MAVTITQPRVVREKDEKTGRELCFVSVRVENRNPTRAKRSVTIYRVPGEGADPIAQCTFEDIEIARRKKFPGGGEIFGSVEVRCPIECPRGGERYLVALGRDLDKPNGAVLIKKADATKELRVGDN
jgi:hypothetical protein